MSLTHKLLDPFRYYGSEVRPALEEVERRAKEVERFMFRVCTNLHLAHSNIGDRRDFYLDKAVKACQDLTKWSEMI